MRHHRGLYWNRNDPIPFCPVCWHEKDKAVHLFGPIDMAVKTTEGLKCDACGSMFAAQEGKSFMPVGQRVKR